MSSSQDDVNKFKKESNLIEQNQQYESIDTKVPTVTTDTQSHLPTDNNNISYNRMESIELDDPRSSSNKYAPINNRDEFSIEEHTMDDETAQLLCGLNSSKKNSVQCSRCATNVIGIILFVAVWKIGMAFENYHVENAPSTTPLYQTQKVCAAVDKGKKLDFLTFDSENDIPDNTTTKIAHCGECGSCSNLNDIGIYKSTTQTLYQNAKICTYRFLVGGRRGMKRCMTKRTTFTPACLDCWVDNMMCDWQLCVFVCLKYSISMMVDRFRNAGHHELNPCLQCDEKRCGPEFLKCAGANRRRCGIISDINRDVDREVCTKVQL